jgi:hypothetical protein
MFAFPLTIWLSILIVSIGDCILNVRIPLKLACGKQQDVVKGRIEWMDICDVLEGRAIPAVENDVTCALWLITISWKNDSDLVVGGIRKIVAVMVTVFIELQSDLALLFWRHVPGELVDLLDDDAGACPGVLPKYHDRGGHSRSWPCKSLWHWWDHRCRAEHIQVIHPRVEECVGAGQNEFCCWVDIVKSG